MNNKRNKFSTRHIWELVESNFDEDTNTSKKIHICKHCGVIRKSTQLVDIKKAIICAFKVDTLQVKFIRKRPPCKIKDNYIFRGAQSDDMLKQEVITVISKPEGKYDYLPDLPGSKPYVFFKSITEEVQLTKVNL